MDGADNGRHQCVRVILRAYEHAATPAFLVGRLVNRHGRRRYDVFVVNIRHYTDDAPWLRTDADEFHDWVCPLQVPVHGVLTGKQLFCNTLTDDDDAFGAITIAVPEIPT